MSRDTASGVSEARRSALGSITYPDVTGTVVPGGFDITVGTGDLVTGRDDLGRLVVGRVIATHGYYPSLTVEGIELDPATGKITTARSVLKVSRVLTHVRAPRHVGQGHREAVAR